MTSLFDSIDVDGLPDVLAPSRRLTNRRNAERLDLALPTCPSCGELCFPGATRCDACCTHLFQRSAGVAVTEPREGLTSGYVAPSQPRPTTSWCSVCLVECDDLTCPICGGLLRKAA